MLQSLVDAATDQLHSSVKSQLTQVADDQRSLSMVSISYRLRGGYTR